MLCRTSSRPFIPCHQMDVNAAVMPRVTILHVISLATPTRFNQVGIHYPLHAPSQKPALLVSRCIGGGPADPTATVSLRAQYESLQGNGLRILTGA